MNIDTSKLADTEAGSTIPPWPIDFGPKEPPPGHLDDSAEMLGLLMVYACIVAVIVGAIAAVVL